MVQITLVNNSDAKLNKAKESLLEIRDKALEEIIIYLITNSPVDTGTYIESHEILSGLQAVVESTSSKGKPQGQSKGAFIGPVIDELIRKVKALPKDQTIITIGNIALHAQQVENLYSVYAKLKRESRDIVSGVSIN